MLGTEVKEPIVKPEEKATQLPKDPILQREPEKPEPPKEQPEPDRIPPPSYLTFQFFSNGQPMGIGFQELSPARAAEALAWLDMFVKSQYGQMVQNFMLQQAQRQPNIVIPDRNGRPHPTVPFKRN